jgi:hypothetical protein
VVSDGSRGCSSGSGKAVVEMRNELRREERCLLMLLASLMPCQAQYGRFYDGYKHTDRGVSIELRIVQTGPRYSLNAPQFMVICQSQKRATLVEISVTLAGFDFPWKTETVPGRAVTRDVQNRIFAKPLSEVSKIDVLLFKGTRQIGAAEFH